MVGIVRLRPHVLLNRRAAGLYRILMRASPVSLRGRLKLGDAERGSCCNGVDRQRGNRVGDGQPKLDLDCPLTTALAAAPLGMRRLHKVGRSIRRLFGKVINHDAANGLGHCLPHLPHPGVHFDALTTRSAER